MDIALDSVVVSLAGHDKGGIFAVTGLSGADYALLSDGKLRKLEKPKKKKLKHLRVIGRISLPEPGEASNRALRRQLKEFGATDRADAEGGM